MNVLSKLFSKSQPENVNAQLATIAQPALDYKTAVNSFCKQHPDPFICSPNPSTML